MAADFQSLLNNLGLLLGGSLQPNPPGYYSGGGVSLLKGVYSKPPFGPPAEVPAGILLPKTFKAELGSQGYENNIDIVRFLVIVKKVDMATDLAILMPFRGSVAAIFRTHMQVDTMAGATILPTRPLYAYLKDGKAGTVSWGGVDWYGWDFLIEVRRVLQVTYVA